MLDTPLPGLVSLAAITQNSFTHRSSAANAWHGWDIFIANGICLHNCTFKYLHPNKTLYLSQTFLLVSQFSVHSNMYDPSNIPWLFRLLLKCPYLCPIQSFSIPSLPFKQTQLCLFLFLPVKIKCWLNPLLHLLYASSRACNLLEKCMRMPTILT